MPVAPEEVRYAGATTQATRAGRLTVDVGAAGTRTVFAELSTASGFPSGHLAAGTHTFNISTTTTGLTPPTTGQWGIALVADNSDANQDYFIGGDIVDYKALGQGNALPSTTTLTAPTSGVYRVVLMVGNNAANAQSNDNVQTGGASSDYHFDADGGVTRGNLAPNVGTPRAVAVICARATLQSIDTTPGDNLRYGQLPTITFNLDPVGSATFRNVWNVRVGVRQANTDGALIDAFNITPDTTGAATTGAFNVDTDYSASPSDYYLHMGVNNTLGNATTPAGQKPGIYSVQTPLGITTSQQSWVVFHTTGHGAGITRASESRAYDIGDTTISSRITIYEDAGKVTTGAAPFKSNAYTNRQDIFRRNGPTLTTNSNPHLECYVFDGYGNALANTAVTGRVRREADNGVENTQNLTTDANGRIRWNYNIPNTAPAFSRFVKSGSARQSGGHVATGPDNPASPPATFTNGNSDFPADYPGPYPGYGRKVEVAGGVYGAAEPTDSDSNVFGVNSEIIFEDIWTGTLTAAALDGNGVPTGAGQREQVLGSGSLKAKLTSSVNEGNGKVIVPGEHNPKDVAGRKIVVTSDFLYLRRALWNDTLDSVIDAGTNLNDAQNRLDTALGYNVNNNSLDSIAAPADPSALIYWQGGADTTGQRGTLSLTVDGVDPSIGFTGDSGNFGYFEQPISFIALDSSIKLIMTSDIVQSDPTLVRRFAIKVLRVTADNQFVDVEPDSAPVYAVYSQPATGALTLLDEGLATAIGAEPTPDWEFNVTIPADAKMIKAFAIAKVNGSRTIGGDVQPIQVGFEFDAVGTLTGLQFK